ncbi:MAG: STAS domain-containing protein [Chthoniobacterales bacterium]
MSALQLTPTTEGTVEIVELAGRLDQATAAEFDAQLAALVGNRVVLDLAKLEYVSSAGLRSVLGALKRAGATGGAMALAAPIPSVVEVFEISGFITLVKIYPDRAAAVAALS